MIHPHGKRYAGVQFRIKAGFRIYATLEKGAPFVSATVVFEFSEGIEAVGGLIKPKEVLLEGGEEMMVYKKEAEFLQEISGAKEGYVKCTIGYQCCDAMICMPPEKKEITIQFSGTGNGE